MRFQLRFLVLTVLAGALLAATPAAAQAAVGIEKFVAVNCSEGNEACAQETIGPYSFPKEPTEAEALAQGELQAGGRVPFGVTDFKVTTTGPFSKEVPTGKVSHIRTDVAPGLATAPTAVPQCSEAEFGTTEVIPGTGFFTEPTCKPETKIGVNTVTVYAEQAGLDVPISGAVYNLEQPAGLASEFGVALELPKGITESVLKEIFKGANPPVETAQYFAHTLIEGNVEWGKESLGTNQGDYHDYFEINVSTALPLVSSRLVFYGRSGRGDFITNATSCPGNNTTRLALEEENGTGTSKSYTTPVGLKNCSAVPFSPGLSISPETTASDHPDGITSEVTIPHDPTSIDTSQVKTAKISLPEGMTLNPSAAAGLTACTEKQARIHSETFGTDCPKSSEVGTATLEVPTLPAGSLTGSVYLGAQNESGTITNPPFPMYVVANSERYGVSVRIKGVVELDEATGRVSASFTENPEQPFSNLTLHFKGGPLAPIANPLACGTATTNSSFTPFSGTAAQSPTSAFTVTNGSGGSCANPLPFSPTQSTVNQAPGDGGANTSFAINYDRAEGDQYLAAIKTLLPAGLVGKIPAVAVCGEPQADKGECPSSSQIGVVRVTAGSGPTPYTFTGTVALTGPYGGGPYGLSIVVPANAGPFQLGNVITRGTINVDPTTARVSATTFLPKIFKGIPLRLRSLHIEINKQGFLINPTNCGVLATESPLAGFVPGGTGTDIALSTPFQVNNCSALAFKPKFTASTTGKTSKANGASLVTNISQPAGQANIKSVMVQLPPQLPSRLTTLQKSCPEKTFANSPAECPVTSKVGGATVVTPVLPNKLTGSAYLVSHGGEAFPDLDLVLSADSVRVILTGNTAIKKGITTTTFASTPDVPVSSVQVNLPVGSHSALAANGNLCATKLVMPTTITAQNGKSLKQNTTISVSHCGVRIVGHKTVGNTAYLTVHTYAPGRISGKGNNVATVFRKLKKAQKTATLQVRLSRRGRSRRRPLRTKIRVGFIAAKKGSAPTSAAYVTVTFR
jgi:hypothetical protein